MRDATAIPETSSEKQTEKTKANAYVIASALRTLEVLDAFARPPHRMGLADVVETLGLERNQAYRSLKTLEAGGYLVQDEDARFELGPNAGLLATAGVRHRSATLMDVAGPHLDRLSDQTRETVHLFVREGDQVVCVDRRESTQSVRLISVLGRSFPLHAGAVPKAILAHLPEADRGAILDRLESLPAYTDRTILEREALERKLAEIRERGWAVSDEDFDASARGVGAPVFGPDGVVMGGISVGGPSFRVDGETLDRFAQLVIAAAGEISRRLALAGRS